MSEIIDLEPYFQPSVLKKAFLSYVESKRDRINPEKIRISMGADGITHEDFIKNLDKNVKDIRNSVLEGKYIFYPLREVHIEKQPGNPVAGLRTLSVPAIRDMLVQKQLYEALHSSAEKMFAHYALDK